MTKSETPTKIELETLYNGNHPDCNNVHLSIRTLASYYTKKYQRKITTHQIIKWLKEYSIPRRDLRAARIPIPSKNELEELYIGTHPSTDGNALKITEIADFYAKKYGRSISQITVRRWFKKLHIKTKREKSPIPPKKELEGLYAGSLPLTKFKPFSQYDIASFYSKKYEVRIDQSTVHLWFKKYGIKARKMIPMPERAELVSLYNGYHHECGGKPFSQMDIAHYYSNKNKYTISRITVARWLNRYKIEKRHFKLPLPSKKELKALYNGSHSDCQGRSLSQYEIALYYKAKFRRNVDQTTISTWFKKYKIETRNSVDSLLDGLWKQWELITYEIADYLLSDEIWESGHGKNRIKTPLIPENNYIEPEIIVYFSNGKIKKIIDAKKTKMGVNLKDTEIYPKFSKIVEFWILNGISEVELHYFNGSVEKTAIFHFDEGKFLEEKNIEKIFVYLNSDELIMRLKQKIKAENEIQIMNLINRIGMIERENKLSISAIRRSYDGK